MAGHGNGNSDSESTPPRAKHSSASRGRELKDHERAVERSREREQHRKGRDSDRNEARYSEIDEPRSKDRDFVRERERETERDRERERRDRDRDRDRDTDRDRDRVRDRDRDRDRDKGREHARDADRDKERERRNERGRGREGRERSPDDRVKERRSPRSHFSRTSAPSPPKKRGRASSSSPPPRTSATSMRDEVSGEIHSLIASFLIFGFFGFKLNNKATNHEDEYRLEGSDDALAKMKAAEADLEEKQKVKEKPSFEYSGKLAAETNKVRDFKQRFLPPEYLTALEYEFAELKQKGMPVLSYSNKLLTLAQQIGSTKKEKLRAFSRGLDASIKMDGYKEEGSSSQDRQSNPTVHEVGEGSSQAEEGFSHAAFSITGTVSPGTLFGGMQSMVPNPMYANIGLHPGFQGTQGVTLLFTEPPEARKPNVRWRLYIFKDGEPFNEPLYIHRQTCYLFGRERRVADVPTDHPSCSKQHAVIQYRSVENEVDASNKSEVRPYLMDLGSTNGTFINGERIDSQRYYELMEKDTIKFGNSSREYVLLHERSAG
ncbi:hypothetical protein L7F22_035610 [Adiantum nelumboides]|nr:hypothetical protein [Adiantum nelumboides]